MSDTHIPKRDADDAKADDGPPTDAASDEVKAASASDELSDSAADETTDLTPSPDEEPRDLDPTPADETGDPDTSPADEAGDATARVDEPTG